ncbi:MAG: FlgD immunoglobulin-like domain containing protein [Actinomycetota bacterium]
MLVGFAVVLVAAGTVPGVASAAGVMIQSPVQDEEYAAPYEGPLTVDFTGATPDTYTLTVSGADNIVLNEQHVYDGTNHTFSQELLPITEPGSYEALVVNPSGTEMAKATFSVRIDDATIVSPDNGKTFFAPFSRNISVKWSSIAHPDGIYQVKIERNGFPLKTLGCHYPGADLEGTTTQCPLSLQRVGKYDARVSDPSNGQLDHVAFQVVPRLRLSDVRVGPATFFPLVRDGFRDTTTIRFRTNKRSHNRIKVMRAGRTIKRVDLGNQSGSSHQWKWNGRNGAGRKVKPGYYKLQVIASALGETKKVSRRVKAHTRVLRKNFSKSKRGTDYRSRGKRGNCNFLRSDGEALLTCLFGVAWVDYAFQMSPGSLRHIVRGPVVDGAGFSYRHGIVRCHAASAAARRGNTLITRFISNGSNGWSQCRVVRARVRYHYFYRQ